MGLVKRESKTHYIPVWDCPHCGSKDTILSSSPTFVHPITGEEIAFWYCSNPKCEIVPEFKKEIKGYLSIEDIEAMGWVKADEAERTNGKSTVS